MALNFGADFNNAGEHTIANINKNINPSMLRHSFAIHLLNEGANIAVVSKILGNANLSSLQAYLNHINKNMRREIKEKHSDGELLRLCMIPQY